MNKLILTSATALILGVAAMSSAQAQTQMNQQPAYNAAPGLQWLVPVRARL